MNKFRIILLSLLLPALPLGAQDAKELVKAFGANVAAVECDFTQTRESALLADAAVSTGHMTYRQPGFLEWQYLSPFQLSFVADDGQVSIKRDGRSETLGGNQRTMMKELTQLIVGSIEGSALTDEKRFRTQVEEADRNIVVTLLPVKREMQKIWSRMVLYYDKTSAKATRFELYEASGDRTIITFSNVHYDFSE